MTAEEVYQQLCNLQSYSHQYLTAKAFPDIAATDWQFVADSAMHCMSIAWAIADQLETMGAGAGPVHDAFTRLAERWSRSVDATVKQLPAKQAATIKRAVGEARAAAKLPEVPAKQAACSGRRPRQAVQ